VPLSFAIALEEHRNGELLSRVLFTGDINATSPELTELI